MPKAGVFAFGEMANHIVAFYLKYYGTTATNGRKNTYKLLFSKIRLAISLKSF